MNADVLIVFTSIYHGASVKIAEAMAVTLNCEAKSIDEAKNMDLSMYRYIGLGSGIYFTSHHPDLIQFVSCITNQQKVFLFSSHGAPYRGKYHNTLKAELETHHINLLGEFDCRGYDCTGPFNIYGGGNIGKPNERDLARAQKFVTKLFPQYIKVTHPLERGKHVGICTDMCIGCGACVQICPLKVFELIDHKASIVQDKDCIHCNLCVERCPEQIISIEHSWMELIRIANRHKKRRSL